MIHQSGPFGKIIFAAAAGLLTGFVTASWFSSLRETTTSTILVVGFQFLVGAGIGTLTRGKQAAVAVVTCAVSLLGWPAWNGMLRQPGGLEFYGALEVAPTIIGGFLARFIHNKFST